MLSIVSCDDFLNTKYYNGIDLDGGLNSVSNISVAANGIYSTVYGRYFLGNYAVNIGEIATDLSYWNGDTQHWDQHYNFTINPTDTYLYYIWAAGYSILNNTTRVINAAAELYDESTEDEQAELDLCAAESYALRGYASLILTNVFCHQAKVNGTDFTSMPGIVIVDKEPIPAFTDVERSTIAKSYEAVISDFDKAIAKFEAAGGDSQDGRYIGIAATYGLKARANLYLENWADAIDAADKALAAGGDPEIATTAAAYKANYAVTGSNTESFFYLAIDEDHNWSANSCGTLWTSYNMSPSPKLQSLYAATDVRTSIMAMDEKSTPAKPIYDGGKYNCASGNAAEATNYLVNAPEMHLIKAEAYAHQSGKTTEAKAALFNVAKRNTAIASVDDLPGTAAEILAFIKDERARELFQEGLRLWDLRRWGDKVNVCAHNAPAVDWMIKDYQISDMTYPIPTDEINSGFGVTQNEGWKSTFPSL